MWSLLISNCAPAAGYFLQRAGATGSVILVDCGSALCLVLNTTKCCPLGPSRYTANLRPGAEGSCRPNPVYRKVTAGLATIRSEPGEQRIQRMRPGKSSGSDRRADNSSRSLLQ